MGYIQLTARMRVLVYLAGTREPHYLASVFFLLCNLKLPVKPNVIVVLQK